MTNSACRGPGAQLRLCEQPEGRYGTAELQRRQLSYATRVLFNGNLMVGKGYTAQLGLEPGDEFEIKLGRKQIKLIPLGATEQE